MKESNGTAAWSGGVDEWIQLAGPRLHLRRWPGRGVPFVLLHGLASNCLTWEMVARRLSAAGHPVFAVDQRGHGLSDKPEVGYGFDEVTSDLRELLDRLGRSEPPIVAGQSWGGNVVLDFAARYPGVARGLVLVDGGFLELSARPGATWEQLSAELAPPSLAGQTRDEIAKAIRKRHPDWSEEGVELTLGNFETLPNGSARVWLSRDHHMEILGALWEHHPPMLYGRVQEPVLITPAVVADADRMEMKKNAVEIAEERLARCRVSWFAETDHDVHVHRPDELAATMLEALRDGFFR
jgi:pimeloyl-ACP methyl ester carboxylesterase